MTIPEIAHADVSINERNRVVIQMHEGYSFYDRSAYEGLTDEEGNAREPKPDEIAYSKYGVFAPDTDFNARFVVVKDGETPADNEATEADYINALEELGVTFNE